MLRILALPIDLAEIGLDFGPKLIASGRSRPFSRRPDLRVSFKSPFTLAQAWLDIVGTAQDSLCTRTILPLTVGCSSTSPFPYRCQ